MGIFDFVKSVGTKLGFGDDEPKAEDLKKELDSHNLGTSDVKVSVDGDKAVLTGNVKDQSVFEKTIIAVGNSLGVSKVEASELKVGDDAATATEGGAPVFYTVKAGDNLWKIAEAQYGKGQGTKNNIIFEANKPMLTSPDKIYPGQVLRIPPLS